MLWGSFAVTLGILCGMLLGFLGIQLNFKGCMICGCNEDGKTASCHNCIHGKHCQKEVCVNEETTTEEPDYEPEPALHDSDEWNGEESV